MSIQRLRSLAASKQFLAACLFTIGTFIISLVSTYFTLYDTVTQMLANSGLVPEAQIDFIFYIEYAFFVVLFLALASIPLIGQLLIYFGARKQAPMKTTGFSILKGYLMFECIIYGIGVFGCLILLVMTEFSYDFLSTVAVTCVDFAISIMCYNAITAGRDIVRYGYTRRRIPQALPVLMIASICINVGNDIWIALEQFGILPTDAVLYTTPGFLLTIVNSIVGIIAYIFYFNLVVKARDLFAASLPPMQYPGGPTNYQPPENPWTNGSDHGPF